MKKPSKSSKAPHPSHKAKSKSKPKSQPEPNLSRNAYERHLKIHHLIGAGKYPNVSTLAAKLEVSRKTIKRDLQWMKTHWGVPLAYDRVRHGLYYTGPVDKFPGVLTMTEAEMMAIFVATKSLEQYQATPFYRPLQNAFDKLITMLNHDERYAIHGFEGLFSFRIFAPEVVDLQRFAAITRALHAHHVLHFEYHKPGSPGTEMRCVHPYHLAWFENIWYLIGFDEARDDTRTFAIYRIRDRVTLGEKFQRPAGFDMKKYLRGSFGIMKGEGNYDIEIEFDPWATDMVRGRIWHETQQITELPNGGSRYTMKLSALEEIERWILSWGTHATVLNPPELANRIGNIARQLSKRYPSPTSGPPN